MIITAVCITRIQLIYWSVTWKVELFKKNAKILDTGYQVSKEIVSDFMSCHQIAHIS